MIPGVEVIILLLENIHDEKASEPNAFNQLLGLQTEKSNAQ